MLKNEIISILKNNLGYQPTPGQEKLIIKLADFILRPGRKEVLVVKGYAGTGKTTLVRSLVRTLGKLKIRSLLLTPTGRAAKVLAAFTGVNAYTIHKKIYRQKSSKDGFGTFVLEKNLHSNTYFIIDEASMISNQTSEMSIFGSGRLLDDLISYVYNNKKCKLILIGDTAQLPPVGLDISPALDLKNIHTYGLVAEEVFLPEIIRHSKDSGILFNATKIRSLIEKKRIKKPQLSLKGFHDIVRISGEDLTEEIEYNYDHYGIDETLIVVRSNKMANRYNQGIRSRILWREDQISAGDYLMIVKNNYYWLTNHEQIDFIANGDIMEIIKIHNFQERYGFHFADLSMRFVDYQDTEVEVKIMLDTLNIETPALNMEQNKNLFNTVLQDYQDIKSKKEQFDNVKNNPFFNALQVKFAYAVTCHKAQGGQWKVVFIDQGYIYDDSINLEYLRWLYTAVTRSTEKLYLVNFSDQFFEEDKSEK
jgi:exodeoxyribonuclease-5